MQLIANFSLRFVRSRDGGVTRWDRICDSSNWHKIRIILGVKTCEVFLFSSYYFPGLYCADFLVACFVLIVLRHW